VLYVNQTKALSLSNLSKKYELKINANATNDAQVVVVHDEHFNKIVKEGVKHRIKIMFTPTRLTPLKSQVTFEIYFVYNKKTVMARTFIYDLYSDEVRNPYKLDTFPIINLNPGQAWETVLSFYNPTSNTIQLKDIASDSDMKIKVPLGVQDIIDARENPEVKKTASSLWSMEPLKTKKFLHLTYRAD
jgi:hypothetical protein